jgi:trk system potassium uptake protein TrkA
LKTKKINRENLMNIVIVGCGRVGVELHSPFTKIMLSASLIGTCIPSIGSVCIFQPTIQGHGMDHVERAGIKRPCLAAVTSSDNVNAIVARIKQGIYSVNHVVARIYNPARQSMKTNLQTVPSSS